MLGNTAPGGPLRAKGDDGLRDRRSDCVSGIRTSAGTLAEVPELFATRCCGCTAKHFHDKLLDEFGIGLSCNWPRMKLQEDGCDRQAVDRSRAGPLR